MALVISPAVRHKLSTKHDVTQEQVEECFRNHDDGTYLIDTREEHATNPPTLWFIGTTDVGRELKIVFVHEHGNLYLRTAYTANAKQKKIYNNLAKTISYTRLTHLIKGAVHAARQDSSFGRGMGGGTAR